MRRSGRLAASLLGAVVLAVLAAPLFAALLGTDPLAIDPSAIYAAPSFAHPFGTDELGRDVLLRLLYGGRISLAVALSAAVIATALGGALGLFAGYRGGAVDAALMRLTEAALAVPKLPLMMILAAVDPAAFLPEDWAAAPGVGAAKLVLIIALFGWMGTARLARAQALAVSQESYVLAARGLGASEVHILLRHVLPNAAAPLLVAATLEVGELIIYENILSFLGLGILPPTPSWGALLAKGFTYLDRAPLLVVLPGALTFVTVAAVNGLGDGLRDALDPRTPRGS